jgi:hypothetical protein
MNRFLDIAKRKSLSKSQPSKKLFTTGVTTMDFLTFLTFFSIDFLLVGGHATSLYMPKRHTKDIDLLIRRSDAKQAYKDLILNGAAYVSDLSIGGSSYILNGEEIDIILYEDSIFNKMLSTSKECSGIKVISLEYLIFMKLQAGRVQDLADITKMLAHASTKDINKVSNLINKVLPNEIEDFMSLVELSKYEVTK